MEESVINNKHAGWSDSETNLLWETADEAQQQGLPLKQVFERIARQTGRRPNSIRNYYYAQVREREGGHHTARFVPFTEPEVRQLVEKVLRARASGQSVRACLQTLSGGDHSLMLRYQNKYRSVLKNRPDLIEQISGSLREEGVECGPVAIHPRRRVSLNEACDQLNAGAQQAGDPELIRACEALTRLMLSVPGENHATQMDRMSVRLDLYRLTLAEQSETLQRLSSAAEAFIRPVKDFLILSPEEKTERVHDFCGQMSELLGPLESARDQAARPAE